MTKYNYTLLDDHIMSTARLFAAECSRLEQRREGTRLRINLSVHMKGWKSDAQPEMCLEATFDVGSSYEKETVKASSIGKLMDEVYHRLRFSDVDEADQAANNAALTAITDARPDGDHERRGGIWDGDGEGPE